MHAYRTPAVVDPEPLPNACVPGGPAPASPWRHLTPGIVRALGVATALFLIAGAASLGALTWRLAAAAPLRDLVQDAAPLVQTAAAPLISAPPPKPARAPAPRVTAPVSYDHRTDESALALAGPFGTYDPRELWSRAQRIHAQSPGAHLSHTTIPLRALTSGEAFNDLHVTAATGFCMPSLRVTALHPRSVAARAGLRKGDVITGINGHAPGNPYALREAMEDVVGTRTALLEIRRPEGLAIVRVDLTP